MSHQILAGIWICIADIIFLAIIKENYIASYIVGEKLIYHYFALIVCYSEGRSFLMQLAHRTGGRYHVAMATSTSPLVGDDMDLLNKEITKLNSQLSKVKELL